MHYKLKIGQNIVCCFLYASIKTMQNKIIKLKEYLKNFEKVAVAFSGGVDSTFLLYVAKAVLGEENVVAISAAADFFVKKELVEAQEFCKKENVEHIIFNIDKNNIDSFCDNPKNRCYLCKRELFKKIIQIASENNITNILEGSNADDINDYRPGLKALLELKIKSPLKEFGFTKKEIRELSKEYNLKTFNKPSCACLASRFVYGEKITDEKLKQVEFAEEFLYELGFKQTRVRIHSNIARIEISPLEFDKLLSIRKEIVEKLKSFGFKYITLDLEGYRTGSMNEVL